MIKKIDEQTYFIFVYLIVLFGYIFTHGFYSFKGFLLLLLAFFLLCLYRYRKKGINNNLVPLLIFTLITSIVLSLILYGGLYQQNDPIILISILLLFFLIPLSLLYLSYDLKKISYLTKNKFLVMVFIAVLLRLLMIISSPNPKIDVFDQLKDGSKAITQFQNPYKLTFNKIYPNQIPIVFGYLPGSILIMAPFSIVSNDPRLVLIFADVGAAMLLYIILKKYSRQDQPSIISELIALIYLFNPMSLYVIEQSWLEPLVTFFVYLIIWAYINLKNTYWLSIILGISLTIKQSVILLIFPFLLKLNWKPKQLMLSFIICSAIVAPFFFISPKDFIFDLTAGFNPLYNTAPVQNSLNITGFLYDLKLSDLHFLTRISVVLVCMLIILWKLKKGLNGFVYSFTMITFTVILFYSQAFLNYYTFLSSLILLTLSVSLLYYVD